MYKVTPQKSNRVAPYTSGVLLIGAFLAMFFSTLEIPYRSVMQLIALIMLSFSVLMLTRYTLASYSYAVIQNADGECDLVVTELKRKSGITVCRIGLRGIEDVTLAKRADKALTAKLKERSKGRKSYNYSIDLAPAEYIHILTEECGESLTIKLSYDERLFAILKDAATKNNEPNISL